MASDGMDDYDFCDVRSDTSLEYDDDMVVFISDLHTNPDGYQPEKLRKVISGILAMRPLPRNVIALGDLAYLTGRPDEYAALKPVLAPIEEAGISLTLAMGNHDRRAEFGEAFPEHAAKSLLKDRYLYIVRTPYADFIVMDSLQEGEDTTTWITPGSLNDEQREWLEKTLAEYRKPVFVCSHHGIRETGLTKLLAGTWRIRGTPVTSKRRFRIFSPGARRCLKIMETEERKQFRKKVLDFLEAHGIAYRLYEHPEFCSVADGLEYWKEIHGGVTHCKNLFMRNHKGNRHYLISMDCHKEFDIHGLEHKLHEGKLSFASEERMMRCLGVHPGSVCAFGLINDMALTGADPKELFENGHGVKYYLGRGSRMDRSIGLSYHLTDLFKVFPVNIIECS